MNRYLLETSKTVSLLKILCRRYYYLDRRLDNFYKDSQTYHLIDGAFDKIKKNFKYSFVDRVSEIREGENTGLLNNSRVVRYWMDLLNSWRNSIVNYSNTSRIMASARAVGKKINYRPIKMGSAIVVCAIAVNVSLSFLLKREISLFAWVIRGLFLFIGINGLFCNMDWLILKNNSRILRLIRKSQK